jgi:DNA-binding SARP family transcriptional activator
MATLALTLCGRGGLELSADGLPVEPSLGAKTLALLAFLCLERGPHRREALTALLWGEYEDEKAKTSFRQALSRLRDAVGDVIVGDRVNVELIGSLTCDVAEFERLTVSDPRGALEIDVPSFFHGVSLRSCPDFDDWVNAKRVTLVESYSRLLAQLANDALATHAWRDAVQMAERWSEVEPLADAPVAAIMEARFLAGDPQAALATYSRHASRLAAEVRRTPGKAIVELSGRLRRALSNAKTARPTETWLERGPTFDGPLVGREMEWERLKRSWATAEQGESRLVLIEGEPGAGKTRIADDFLRWVTAEGGLALRGRGYDARGGAPFGAVVEALRTALDAPALAGVDAEWLAELSRLLPELRRRFANLPESRADDRATDSWRLFEAVAQVLIAIAEDSPLAIFIDDLQWCDADSCSLLHFLVRRLESAPVLWCATLTAGATERDAPAARLARAFRAARGSSTIALRALTEEEVWRLIRELSRVTEPSGGRRLACRVFEVTAGNPFYVVELLKTLFAQDVLSVDEATGGWTVREGAFNRPSPAQLTTTIHETIMERIECLAADIHEILVSIAVSGRGCPTDVLSHLHGISRLHAAALGDALVERHLVVEHDGRYHCAHPTIANVVRSGLTTSRRREVHRALALALELLLPNRGPNGEEAGEVARHADEAGDRAMTYRYALLAADACGNRFAHEEALSWLDLAAATAETAEEVEAVDRLTAQILDKAGWVEPPAVRAPAIVPIGRVVRADLDLPARG